MKTEPAIPELLTSLLGANVLLVSTSYFICDGKLDTGPDTSFSLVHDDGRYCFSSKAVKRVRIPVSGEYKAVITLW